MLKGRKKGSSKKTSSSKKKGKTTALLGVSSSGLNSDGIIEASLIKERLKTEMNNALAKAKTDEEKIAIRKEYSKKANAEIAKLKADPKFAKQKATSSKSSKSSGSSGSKSSKSSGGSSSKTSSSSGTTQKASTTSASTTSEADAKALEIVKDVGAQINDIYSKISTMSPEEKTQAREAIQGLLDALKKRLR